MQFAILATLSVELGYDSFQKTRVSINVSHPVAAQDVYDSLKALPEYSEVTLWAGARNLTAAAELTRNM